MVPKETSSSFTTEPIPSTKSRDVPPIVKTISAMCGAFLTSLVTTPLEVVKTRIQTVLPGDYQHAMSRNAMAFAESGKMSSATLSSSVTSRSKPFMTTRAPTTSSIATLLAVARMEGFRGLWSGLAPSLLMQIPSTALYFTAYDELKEYLENEGRQRQWIENRRRHNSSSSSSTSSSRRSGGPNTTSASSSNASTRVSGNSEHVLVEYAPLISGVLSRVLAVTVVSPLELLRTKAMYRGHETISSGSSNSSSSNNKSNSTSSTATGKTTNTTTTNRNISTTSTSNNNSSRSGGGGMIASARAEINAGGVKTLWRGLGPTLLRDVPFSGVYWYGYERIKRKLFASPMIRTGGGGIGGGKSPSSVSATSNWAVSFFAGFLSGSFAALITTPFDVVKTRKQVQVYRSTTASLKSTANAAITGTIQSGKTASTTSSEVVTTSSLTTPTILRMILRDEGLKGLFAGVEMRVARVGPACAIMISSYEFGKRLFTPDSIPSSSSTTAHMSGTARRKEEAMDNDENSMLASKEGEDEVKSTVDAAE